MDRAGVQRSKPIPGRRNSKTSRRLQTGDSVLGVRVFVSVRAERPRHPGEEIPATRQFTRTFGYDKQYLQREQKRDVPGFLTTAAYLAVPALAVALIGAIAWGLRRVRNAHRQPAADPPYFAPRPAEEDREGARRADGRMAPAS
jgi:hypothetical protein